MSSVLSPELRRAAALAILAAILLLAWSLLIQPLFGIWGHGGQGNDQARRLLSEYKRALADKPQWEALLGKTRDPKYAAALLSDTNPTLTAAKFQEEIKQAIESSGATVQSIQLLPAAKEHDLQRHTVRVMFSIASDTLPELLKVIERHKPYLFFDNLAINSNANGAPNTSGAPLSIRCDFFAYAAEASS